MQPQVLTVRELDPRAETEEWLLTWLLGVGGGEKKKRIVELRMRLCDFYKSITKNTKLAELF